MTISSSLGDLSRAVSLRQANVTLKSRLATLTDEATTGLKSDVPAALNGELGRLSQIEGGLTTLKAFQRNAVAAEAEFQGLQEAMGAIQDVSTRLAAALPADASLADGTTLDLRAREADEDLRAVLRFMNVNVGGKFMLSGAALQTPPIRDAGQVVANARAVIAGQSTPAGMISALEAWFDAPVGGGGFADAHYAGATAGTTAIAVGADSTVENDATALSAPFREILKGLTLAALAADPALGLATSEKATLMTAAGQRLAAGDHRLTMERASVGLRQETIERAATRNAAETTGLSIARSNLLAADPYETVSALTQAEGDLRNLYALTARLSKLSLADYIR